MHEDRETRQDALTRAYEVWIIGPNGATRYLATHDIKHAARVYVSLEYLWPVALVSLSRTDGKLLTI